MSTKYERFELNEGSVVKLKKCATQEYKSCIEVKLEGVTGIWEGKYKCFTVILAYIKGELKLIHTVYLYGQKCNYAKFYLHFCR